MTQIISASRRTDIPRFYGAWFAARRAQGSAEFRNSFGGKGQASLRKEDVLGYLFWTRFAKPFRTELEALRDDGIPYAFQYTINGYGRDVEPYIPRAEHAVEDFRAVSRGLPSPACIQWRYDPVLLNETYSADFHRRSFRALAAALQGYTRVVNTSLVEPYQKAIRRLADPSVRFRQVDPKRHKATAKRFPDLPQAGAEGATLLADLAAIACEFAMELRVCSNPESALTASQCCSPELFAPYGSAILQPIAALGKGPSRDGCRCLRSVDIGMDNTCLGGCKYCYVVTSHRACVNNRRQHDPGAAMMR